MKSSIGENDGRVMFRIMKDWRLTREVGNEKEEEGNQIYSYKTKVTNSTSQFFWSKMYNPNYMCRI